MEGNSKLLLERLEQQEKQLALYQDKLRDTVEAYKSIVKEKRALESTVKTLTSDLLAQKAEKETEVNNATEATEVPLELKQHMAPLLESIAILTAEKSRIETTYLSDRKRLREEKESIESKCQSLEEQLKRLKIEVDELKSKQNSDKSNIGNHDMRLSQTEKHNKTVTSLTNELKATRKQLEISERKLKDTPSELLKLQDEMRNLQIEHYTALQHEKERVKAIEERAKKMSMLQEERVVNLETQLVELSQSIGSYDRLRIQDQLEIQKLKELIALGSIESIVSSAAENVPEKVDVNSEDIDDIIQQILDLKVKLNSACEKSGRKVDYSKLFDDGHLNIHSKCSEAYNKLKTEFELFQKNVKLCGTQEKSQKEIDFLNNQVKSLQERLRILTEKNTEMQKEHQIQIDQMKSSMKNEKARLKDTLAATESDFRGRLWLLEEQLQKQRERSLALIEEKEQEIQALQNMFHMFMPEYRRKSTDMSASTNDIGIVQVREGPHILHYANELARRDIEIANLRKSKHKSESALRDLQKTVVTDAEKHRDERQALRDEIGRLKLCQTREGANLEYLKNVVLSFLLSNDPRSKRHMCNAIAAVLKFNETELARVTEHSRNSWWSRSGYL